MYVTPNHRSGKRGFSFCFVLQILFNASLNGTSFGAKFRSFLLGYSTSGAKITTVRTFQTLVSLAYKSKKTRGIHFPRVFAVRHATRNSAFQAPVFAVASGSAGAGLMATAAPVGRVATPAA